MKKFVAAILATMMVMSLAGCGKTGLLDGEGALAWAEKDENIEYTEYDDGTYIFEGKMDCVMKTAWFDFTVNDAYLTEDIDGYTPADGDVFLVVDMTLKNTFTESVGMYTYDFCVQWDEDAYTYPIEDEIMDGQYPSDYTLSVDEKRDGVYIFEVPAGYEDYAIFFEELYDDGSDEGVSGDLFAVYFTAEEK